MTDKQDKDARNQDYGSGPVLDGEALDVSEEACTPERLGNARAGGVDEHGRLRSGRLAGLTMWAAIGVLSWPILVESVLNSLVGLVDTTLASQISAPATDAIGVASYFAWFISLFAMALATGATALVSRSVGKGRLGVANAAVGQTMLLAVASGVCVGLLIGSLAPSIASLVGFSQADHSEARAAFIGYMRIIAAGVPVSSVLFAGIACLRGAGDSIRPLWAMVAANVVNMVVSFIASGVSFSVSDLVDGEVRTTELISPVIANGMGVNGIALGTVCAHVAGAAIIVGMLLRGKGGVKLKRLWLGFHPITMIRLARLGLPNFFESVGMWVGNFVVVIMVGWLAQSSLAAGGDSDGLFGAHIWAIRIEAFSFLPGFAMGMAAATLAGQYLGAGRADLASLAIRRCLVIGATLMGLMGVAFVFGGEAIIGTFSTQVSHLELVPQLLVICGVVQVPFGIALVIRSALRGAGDVKTTMWITWFSTYAVRLPMAYALSGVDVWFGGRVVLENPFREEFSLSGLWMGLCGELVIRGAFFTARFLQGGWKSARV
ncbi:MAG: putative MATE family efflux protein [Phycisphaerales bacterium]